MPEWWEAYLPARPAGVPSDIPGYGSPVLQPPSLPMMADEPLPAPEPPMQAPSMLPELTPDMALGELPVLPPPPPPGGVQPLPESAPLAALPEQAPPAAPPTPEEIEAERLQAAREAIGYQPVEVAPDAPLGERLAVERAGIGAEAAAQALSARQKAADERQRLADMEAKRAEDEQKRMADAEKRTAEKRAEYRETLKKSGSWSGKQIAGLVGAALADALAVALQPTGQQRSNFTAILDTFLKANQGAWDNRVNAALDAASEGQDDVDRLVSREREAQRQYHLQRAAVSEALAEELDMVAAQAVGQEQALMATNAADMARAQQAAAEMEAAREDYKLETDRLGKVGQIQKAAADTQLRKEELEQRKIESRRDASLTRRGQDIGLEKERLQRDAQRELKLLDIEANKAERQRKMLETGQLIDSATGKPIVTSRFYEKTEQMIKDQDTVDAYVTSQKTFNEYIDLLKKAGKIGPIEGRIKDDVQRRLDMLHKKILSETISALAGAAVSPSEEKRITATIPGPKSWTDMGSWDPVKAAQDYGEGMADKIDNMLRGRAVAGEAGRVKERSPTARFRALSRSPAETTEDKVQSHILNRDAQLRTQMSLNYLDRLQNGSVTEQEAQTIVRAFTDVATADILSEKDTSVYRRLADRALDLYEQRDQWATTPGLERTVRLGDAWVRGDTKGMRKAKGEKTEAELEREDIAGRRRRVLGE